MTSFTGSWRIVTGSPQFLVEDSNWLNGLLDQIRTQPSHGNCRYETCIHYPFTVTRTCITIASKQNFGLTRHLEATVTKSRTVATSEFCRTRVIFPPKIYSGNSSVFLFVFLWLFITSLDHMPRIVAQSTVEQVTTNRNNWTTRVALSFIVSTF